MNIFSELRLLATLFRMKLNRTLLFIFFVAGLLPPIIFRVIAWKNNEVLGAWGDFIKGLTSSVFMTVAISCCVVIVMIWLHKKYPWRQGVLKRLSLEILLTYSTAFILSALLTAFLSPLFPDNPLSTSIPRNFLIAFLFNSALVAITEGVFFFRQWKESAVAAERFKKESIKAQLENLRSQVNPHFLFNSLNTLSGLIDMDKDLSKEFVDNLSKVYRYVLQHEEEELVSLKMELDFIHAFAQLLKKRHGNGVSFHFAILEKDLKKGIPPMALQLLVENAVKHNIASRKKPLDIEVYSKAGYLIVKNNLQRKKNVTSTGTGLKNIKRRYEFLTDKIMEVVENTETFEVKLPLVNLAGMNDE